MRNAWIAMLLAACTSTSSSEYEGEDCEVYVMAPCPDCGPGEVTGGVGFAVDAGYARLPNGETIVLSCGRATTFDAHYNVVRELEIDVPARSQIASDPTTGTLYVLEVDTSYPEFAPGIAVRAVGPEGATRWRHEIVGDVTGIVGVSTGVVLTDFQDLPVGAYDREGNELPVPAVVGIVDDTGGMIGVTVNRSSDVESTATLTSVDATGTVRWTRTWRAPRPGFPGWLEVIPYPVEGGDVVVAGGFTGATFEVGETTLAGNTETQTAFVARLDPTGATRWAHTLPYQAWGLSAIAHGDGALVAGEVRNVDEVFTSTVELRLTAVSPSGQGDVTPLAEVYDSAAGIAGLYAHGANRMTAVIDLYPVNDLEEELTIGWHRLVSGLGGRRHLVEMAR